MGPLPAAKHARRPSSCNVNPMFTGRQEARGDIGKKEHGQEARVAQARILCRLLELCLGAPWLPRVAHMVSHGATTSSHRLGKAEPELRAQLFAGLNLKRMLKLKLKLGLLLRSRRMPRLRARPGLGLGLNSRSLTAKQLGRGWTGCLLWGLGHTEPQP